MTIDFYVLPIAVACRAVRLATEALGIADQLQAHNVDTLSGEQLNPDFVKMNPQHTVPIIVDEGFPLWESRAILRYLVNKYGGSDHPLYPADPKARAVVDQRLDFDLGTLAVKLAAHFYPRILGSKPEEGSLQKLQDALGFLNIFLEGQRYVAGDNMTVADLSLVATVSTVEAIGVSLNEYSNIVEWYALMKTTAPNYNKANEKPLAEFKTFFDSKM